MLSKLKHFVFSLFLLLAFPSLLSAAFHYELEMALDIPYIEVTDSDERQDGYRAGSHLGIGKVWTIADGTLLKLGLNLVDWGGPTTEQIYQHTWLEVPLAFYLALPKFPHLSVIGGVFWATELSDDQFNENAGLLMGLRYDRAPYYIDILNHRGLTETAASLDGDHLAHAWSIALGRRL